jgi:hypothetical protein
MKRALIPALCAAIAACNSSATAPRVGAEFDLGVRTPAAVEGTPLVVEFDSVLEDTRCPVNAQCVQEGRAAVRILVTYASGPDILHDLRLVDRPDSSTALVGGWFVDFVDLLPHPVVGQEMTPESRRVRLRIRQALD